VTTAVLDAGTDQSREVDHELNALQPLAAPAVLVFRLANTAYP
jgi:hypothetical protein